MVPEYKVLIALSVFTFSTWSGTLFALEDSKPLSEKQRQLLKTFVDEFVEVTPGKGRFPDSFEMGSSDGPAS